jgi:arylformamidase
VIPDVPRRLWDISPPVGPTALVYPGDQPYRQRWTATGPVHVSAVTLSPHIGAHADAPLHYAPGAAAVGALDLAPFLGTCRVVHALCCGRLVYPEHLHHAAAGLPPRVLVRTCAQVATVWTEDFTALAPDTIDWLAGQGVRLVGIDTPSVDPADSAALDSHQRLLQHDLRVLENLVLDDVPAGDYELIALPLRWTVAEASPVRAVLRSL